MSYPNFKEEKILWEKGFKYVAGIDEVGRGPLAGPVVAGAVLIMNYEARSMKNELRGVKDSKQLSEKQREKLFEKLVNHKDVKWGVGIASEKIIDKINILEATKLAMAKAIKDLGIKVDYLLIDGNFSLADKLFLRGEPLCGAPSSRKSLSARLLPQKSIIKGDQKVFSISVASIIAKVTRDRLMQKLHKKYPQYGFDKHKGYGTKQHLDAIKKHGPCKIHRKTFYPISSI